VFFIERGQDSRPAKLICSACPGAPIDQWLDGTTSPSPENQGYVAKVTRSAPHLLFPVEVAS